MTRRTHGYRKQILLFLLAVILPSVVLISFTLRMIQQDKELALKRAAEEMLRIPGDIGQYLLVHLENIKIQELNAYIAKEQIMPSRNYLNPEVIFIGQVEDNTLQLPWENSQELKRSRELLNANNFNSRIRQAERQEVSNKNYRSAIGIYRQCLNSFKEPTQKQYAQVLLARTLRKSGAQKASQDEYASLLKASPPSLDEYGIPFALYAAKALIGDDIEVEAAIQRIGQELEKGDWLTPIAAYFIQGIVDSLEGSNLTASFRPAYETIQAAIAEYLQTLEQASELQSDFPSFGFGVRQRNQDLKNQPLWAAYGNGRWLVSLSPSLVGTKSFLIVMNVHKILLSLKNKPAFSDTYPVDFQFINYIEGEGESLGANFQNLKIRFTSDLETSITDQGDLQRNLYLLILLLVLGVTFFGGYLLWRDVRREVRMADMRSQFVSSVSHELKTPLTAIRMFAETLRLGRSRDKQAQEEYLETIVNESQRLTRLLNNVLDFSKIEKGKRAYHKELTSLPEVVQAAANAMAYPLSQQGFNLNVQIENNIPEVQVDKDALEQAILNLLSNAMKYSGDARNIDLRLAQEKGYAVIQVIDMGVGIAPEEQKKIFNKFYRIPNPENERTAGTGLGLALVAHIIESHGGKIEIESSPGQGSTFSIILPLENEE